MKKKLIKLYKTKKNKRKYIAKLLLTNKDKKRKQKKFIYTSIYNQY